MNRLGELERAIMDILWESKVPLTVRQVSGNLTERDLAHTTVMTVLDRLAKKNFARRERDGRAWRYRAAETREAYVTELMLNALEQTGDRQAALARFARSVSETEATALRQALEALDSSSVNGKAPASLGHARDKFRPPLQVRRQKQRQTAGKMPALRNSANREPFRGDHPPNEFIRLEC